MRQVKYVEQLYIYQWLRESIVEIVALKRARGQIAKIIRAITFVFIMTIYTLGMASRADATDISDLIIDLDNKEMGEQASVKLAEMGNPAIPSLIKALEIGTKYQKRYAAHAIREMGQEGSDAINALDKVIQTEDDDTREYAVEALANMVDYPDQAIPILRKATTDKKKTIRTKAINAIHKLEQEKNNTFKHKSDTEINASSKEFMGKNRLR